MKLWRLPRLLLHLCAIGMPTAALAGPSPNQVTCQHLEVAAHTLLLNWVVFPSEAYIQAHGFDANHMRVVEPSNRQLGEMWRDAFRESGGSPPPVPATSGNRHFREAACIPLATQNLEDLYRRCFWQVFDDLYRASNFHELGWGELPTIPPSNPGVTLHPQLLMGHLTAVGRTLVGSLQGLRRYGLPSRADSMNQTPARFLNADRILLDVWMFLNRPRSGRPCNQRPSSGSSFARSVLGIDDDLPRISIHELPVEASATWACAAREIANATRSR